MLLSVPALTLTLACQYVGRYESFEQPSRDAGAGGACGLLDSTVRARLRGPDVQAVATGARCFWIDETEVTNAQYRQFLHSAGAPTSCAADGGTLTTEPTCRGGAPCPAELDAHPVTHVSWCEAQAYCRWANKRLCKDNYHEPDLLAESDWYAACANRELDTAFPYAQPGISTASAYQPELCNGERRHCSEPNGCTTIAGSLPRCRNKVGVLDLSGNVTEWTDSCEPTLRRCRARGGSYSATSGTALGCAALENHPPESRLPDLGFRCCFYPDQD